MSQTRSWSLAHLTELQKGKCRYSLEDNWNREYHHISISCSYVCFSLCVHFLMILKPQPVSVQCIYPYDQWPDRKKTVLSLFCLNNTRKEVWLAKIGLMCNGFCAQKKAERNSITRFMIVRYTAIKIFVSYREKNWVNSCGEKRKHAIWNGFLFLKIMQASLYSII